MPSEQTRNASVAIALVNYCTRDLTVDCLRSLESEIAQWPGCEVVVADNASPDGSGAEIAQAVAATVAMAAVLRKSRRPLSLISSCFIFVD